MGAAAVGLAVCVALLGLLAAGLARRATAAERLVDATAPPSRPAGPPTREPLVGHPAPPVRGVSLAGSSATAPGRPERAVLAFLTGSCSPCRDFWAPLARGESPGYPVTVVTPSPSTESRRGLAGLAGETVAVVMSSEAWLAYAVPGAPWFAVVEAGRVVGEGPAGSWEELVALAGCRT